MWKIIDISILEHPRITTTIDQSDSRTQRTMVCFDNGYSLSVIRTRKEHARFLSTSSCGSVAGLYEIAVFDYVHDYVRFEGMHDNVVGWQTAEEVISWINKVAEM